MRINLKDEDIKILGYPHNQFKLGIQDHNKKNINDNNYNDYKLVIRLFNKNLKLTLINAFIEDELNDWNIMFLNYITITILID